MFYKAAIERCSQNCKPNGGSSEPYTFVEQRGLPNFDRELFDSSYELMTYITSIPLLFIASSEGLLKIENLVINPLQTKRICFI
jgi:hypothetical protein